jgi:hypothetical protein
MSGQVTSKRPSEYRHPNHEDPMLYAILAYHSEAEVASWSAEEDAALMLNLNKVHDRLTQEKCLGPAARLSGTERACVLRGSGAGLVTDGPFAESKEQLLGFYVIDCDDCDAAITAARDLHRVNPGAIYEIRPVLLHLPGTPMPQTKV